MTGNLVRYSLPVDSYTLTFDIPGRDWVVIKKVPTGESLVAEVLEPSATTSFNVNGSVEVAVSARTEAILVSVGGRIVGRITSPALFPTLYELDTRG